VWNSLSGETQLRSKGLKYMMLKPQRNFGFQLIREMTLPNGDAWFASRMVWVLLHMPQKERNNVCAVANSPAI
jgi:hypothetical protein